VNASSLTPSQLEGTIAELERLGYTHVRMTCAACGHDGLTSFFLMRTRGTIAEETTFPEVAERTRCAKCRRNLPAESVRPVHRAEVIGSAGRKVRRDSL
jgi:hypothetical protein